MRKLVSILFTTYMFTANSMLIQNGTTEINFHNEKKPIGVWIKICLTNPKHPFNQTFLYRYKKGIFIFKGILLSLNKKDIHDICHANAVYCTNYEMINAHEAQKVGNILLGINNPKLVKKFYSKNGVVIAPKLIKSNL